MPIAKLRLYSPHEAQKAFHNSRARYRVFAAGRQVGKSTGALNDLVKRAWENPRTTYWFISPTYDQAKVQYRRLTGMLWPCREIMTKCNQSELRIKLINQSQIRFVSGETGQRLRGETLNGVIIDEVRDQPRELWTQVVRPMLTTTGGWAAFLSTPNGFDEFYDLYERAKVDQDWASFSAPSTANPLFTQEEMESARRSMSEPEFAQEIMAEFRDIHRGKAYTFSDANCLEYNPFTRDRSLLSKYLPIVLGLDFNVGHMRWVLGQQRANQFYWFDELAVDNTNTQECAKELVDKLKKHGVTNRLIIVGDASGNARNTKASESDYVILCSELDRAGINWENRTPDANPPVKERVNTVNAHFKDATGQINMWVHPVNCPKLKKDCQRVSWKQGAQTILDQVTDPSLTHASDGMGYAVYALSPLRLGNTVGTLKVIYR